MRYSKDMQMQQQYQMPKASVTKIERTPLVPALRVIHLQGDQDQIRLEKSAKSMLDKTR